MFIACDVGMGALVLGGYWKLRDSVVCSAPDSDWERWGDCEWVCQRNLESPSLTGRNNSDFRDFLR